MKVIRVKDVQEGGKVAFDIMKKALEEGAKVLGLATGSSPITLYEQMIQSGYDFKEVIGINLDEYISLGADNEQSYHYFMEDNLFRHTAFKDHHVPNGLAEDLDAECIRYDRLIEDHPIDFQVLGVGPNGHIGFNEPGTSFDAKTHVVDLTDSTIQANKRFFRSVEEVPTRAITMGIGSIMASKEIILLAYGKNKAEAVKMAVDGPVSEEYPVSVLQNHDRITLIIDEEAAGLLD